MSRYALLTPFVITIALAACGGEDDPLLHAEDELVVAGPSPFACRHVGPNIGYATVADYVPADGARTVFCPPTLSHTTLFGSIEVPGDRDMGPNEAYARDFCERSSARALVYGFRGRTKVFLGWSGWVQGVFVAKSSGLGGSPTNRCDTKPTVSAPREDWDSYDRFEVIGQSRVYLPATGQYALRPVPLRLSFGGSTPPN